MTAPQPDLTAIRAWYTPGRSFAAMKGDAPPAETMWRHCRELLAEVDRLTTDLAGAETARDEAREAHSIAFRNWRGAEAERDALREELAKARRETVTHVCEGCGGNVSWWVDDTGQTRGWRHDDQADSYAVGAHRPVVVALVPVVAVRVPAAAGPAVAKRAILRDIVLGLGLKLSEDNTESALDVLLALFAGRHVAYLSTYCLHGTHDECGAAQHDRGDLSAPHCKGCAAPCICPRHLDPQAPCWGGDQPRRHDPSCALDAGHLGWCGPLRANAVIPLMHAIATWYGTRSTPATAEGDLALAWEEYTDAAGICEFCTRPRCPECLVCPRCAGDGHSESCSQPDLPAEADREVTP